jgi:MtfA peptidase
VISLARVRGVTGEALVCLRGAQAGGWLGLAIGGALAAVPQGGPILLPVGGRVLLGYVAGSALAGALLAGFRRLIRGRSSAVLVGFGCMLPGLAVIRAFMLRDLPLTLPSVLVPVAISLGAGAIAGLLSHDLALWDAGREATAAAPAPLLHRLILWSRRPSGRTRRRRRMVASRPFPAPWEPFLAAALPMLHRLSEADRLRLRGHVQVFLDEKSFEGCGGLEITDEIRVTIAAQACLLALRHDDLYPGLRSILVYPSTYLAKEARRPTHGEIASTPDARLGESWVHGAVVLAWDSVVRGAEMEEDGKNLVMHEFAHQLDQDDGAGDGMPFLHEPSAYRSWSRVMRTSYREHQRRSRSGRATVLDEYGATKPAEFFAVATEAFFERPRALQRSYPDLYGELDCYYGQDPAAWSRAEPY